MLHSSVRVYDPTFLTTIPEDLQFAGAILTAITILRNDPRYDAIRIEGGSYNRVPERYRILENDMNDEQIGLQALMASIIKEGLQLNMSFDEISGLAQHIGENDVTNAGHAMNCRDHTTANQEMHKVVRDIIARNPAAPRPF
jgi:hypothetical protein